MLEQCVACKQYSITVKNVLILCSEIAEKDQKSVNICDTCRLAIENVSPPVRLIMHNRLCGIH